MYACSCRGLLFLVGQWSSLMALNTRRKTMKAWSAIGLLFAATIFAMVPISPQVTPRGVELSVDQAQAITYRRARVTARRVGRRAYWGAAYAVGASAVGYGVGGYYGGYGYPAYSAPSAPYYGTGYGYGSYYGGYGYPAYSYAGYGYPSAGYVGYGYPAYGYGGYYRPGLRIARRVAIHRARWR
jgi:hypothetical protein